MGFQSPSFNFPEKLKTLNIRTILDRERIHWRDKGKNCSKGNVNISCPFCGVDPSEHLSISEDGLRGYYCFRNPAQHSGKNISFLFQKLGIKVDKQLLEDIKKAGLYVSHTPVLKDNSVYNQWRWFNPAEESQEAVDYLFDRQFLFPVEICKKFNLRVTPDGRWAGRLLIPLTVGWTGRSMRKHIEPRYFSETDETGLFIHGRGRTAIIFEGPIDALRVASVTDETTVIGGLGGRISSTLIYILRERNFLDIYNCPDSTVPFDQSEYNRRQLVSYCTSSNVHAAKLPNGKKDAGELNEVEVRQWLTTLGTSSELSLSLRGPARGRSGREDTVFKIFGDSKSS
jgi:hypothetical protein